MATAYISNISVDGDTYAIKDTEARESIEQLTTEQGDLAEQVEACFQSVSDGKDIIATTLTNVGVTTSSDDTFATMAENITKVKPESSELTNAGELTVKDVNGNAVHTNTFSNNYDAGKTEYNPSSATLSNAGALSVKNAAGTEKYTQTFTNSYDAGVTATKKGDAAAGNVLKGKTFTSNTAGVNQTGTMANNGATGTTINPGGSYTIPAGYTSGGTVKANANQNSGTYTYAANSTGGTVDMGVNNTYRYVNAANVYTKGKTDGASGKMIVKTGNTTGWAKQATTITTGLSSISYVAVTSTATSCYRSYAVKNQSGTIVGAEGGSKNVTLTISGGKFTYTPDGYNGSGGAATIYWFAVGS